MPRDRHDQVGAGCAIGGSVLLLVGTVLHPSGADPHDSVAAFTEYAADRSWVSSHLLQLAGLVLMAGALLVLTRRLMAGPGGAWSLLGSGVVVAGTAVAGVLQAVDGVALKVMVDRWAAAPDATTFEGAFAVRQVEIGLAAVLGLLLGLGVTAFGVALLVDRRYPTWSGVLALAGGLPTLAGGVVLAHQGFSGPAMSITLPANLLLVTWTVGIGVLMARRPAPAVPTTGAPSPG